MIEEVFETFRYDEQSPSCLIWICSGKSVGGQSADSRNKTYKRWRCTYKYKQYFVHNLIWYLFHGTIPSNCVIDHIDGNPLNNKIDNLRVVKKGTNNRNSRVRKDNNTGFAGVVYNKRDNAYRATVKYLGVAHSRSFSIAKYGDKIALELAIQFRKDKMTELNFNGADFTERHMNGG